MSHRLMDYLSRETADYLDQLERVLAKPGDPDAEQVLQLTRGARGSAEMAGLAGITRVAERLEAVAHARAQSAGGWDDATRATALATVRDLQGLVRAIDRWGPEEEALVRRAERRWDEPEAIRADGASRSAERTNASDDEVVPVSDLFYEDEGPHILQGPLHPEQTIVPVEQLLLRGGAALREALRLRPELERLLGELPDPETARLVSELFELIELALPAEANHAG